MAVAVEENARSRTEGGTFHNVVQKTKSLSNLLGRRDGSHGPLPRIFSKIGPKQWEADSDLPKSDGHSGNHGFGLLLLAFQAIGVVYGDIGTSPLYVYASIFPDAAPSKEDVIGALSLILYTITISLVFKYALVVLYADDNGNGGTFALFSILRRQGEQGIRGPALPSDRRLRYYRSASGNNVAIPDWRQKFIANRTVQTTVRCLVVIGVGAIMGDGVLTPAISVVSACEGMQVVIPSFSREAIVGMSVGIIVVLFLAQQFGTNRIAFFFSPIITLWLIANAVIGVYNIAKYDPTVFKAVAPNYWFSYFLRNGATGWKSLGGVLLCITGTEALFADLGHFNRRSVLVSCLGLLYPCIVLTYFGQAAYLTQFPEDIGLVYWKSLPYGFLWPMFVLATFAAVIASQALISAVFQIVYQAIAQGFFPRFGVQHTSEHIQGQVYIPLVNWVLMILTVVVVIVFQESAKLGQAYGLAVIVDMILTSHFMTLVITMVWRRSLWLAIPFYVVLLVFEGSFFSASVGKIPQGGWFSVMMAGIYASVMFWWYWGTARKKLYMLTHFMPRLEDFFMLLRTGSEEAPTRLALKQGEVPITRTLGVGLYYSETIYGTPPVMVELLPYFPVLHEVVIVITNRFVPVPAVSAEERFLVEQVGISGFYHCIARYGYMEQVRQDAPFVKNVLEHVEVLLYRAFENTLSGEESKGFSDSEAVHHGEQEGGKEQQLYRQLEELKSRRPVFSSEHLMPVAEKRVSVDDSALPHMSVDVDDHMGHNNTWPLGAPPPRGLLTAVAPTGLGSMRTELQIGGGGSEHEGLPHSVSISLERRVVVTTEDLSAYPVEAATKAWTDKMVDMLTQVDEVPATYRKLAAIGGEIRAVGNAQENGKVVYVMASAKPKNGKKKELWKRVLLEVPFMFLVHNFHVDASKVFGIPEDKLCEVGMQYHL